MKYSFLILIIHTLLFVSCSSKKETTEETKATTNIENAITLSKEQRKNAGIITDTLQQQPIVTILKLNGKIDVPPQNMVSISIPLGGYLKNSKLLPGVHVNKGEIIAIIEDQQYIQLQQDYLMAKAKILFLENEFNRQKQLNETKASSDKALQQAEIDLKSQQINLTALSEKLKLVGIVPEKLNENNISRSINVYSPINGYVSKVNVNIGKYVSPTDVLFELIDPTDIHLALQVFEKDINQLFIGQSLIAFTNNNPNKKYDCELILIGKDLNQERYAEVHCHFEKYDPTLIPGTYMNAELAVNNKKALVLPEDAIVRFENKMYVFIEEKNNQYIMQQVNIGGTYKGFTEIFDGSQLKGKNIVVKGAYSLLMAFKNISEEE